METEQQYVHMACYYNLSSFYAAADEPQKDEINACVKKITKNIYALLEAHKTTTDK